MTSTEYYVLMTLGLAVFAALVVPLVVKIFQLDIEGERQIAAARQRVAARQLADTYLPAIPDSPPDPTEQT